MIQNLLKYKYMIYYLVERDIKKKYRRSILGIVWSMLNPLFIMLITAIVFEHLFRFDLPNFVLYLIVGQVVLNFFSEATNNAMGAIINNSALIKKVYVPKYMFPIASVISSCVNLILSFPAILGIMIYTNQYPTINIISFLFPLSALLMFCVGVGLILSAGAVFFRDIMHLYGVFITALTYATPIIYPESIVPDKYRFIFDYNPFYYYLKEFRQVLYMGNLPDIDIMAIAYGAGILFLVIGIIVFKKTQDKFILYI